ncbi:rod shape-determining protein [Candidatus Parcubacteria bacterium]|nr:rod shape-determining protein [Candidatus Parcubacteria bacterium]
MVLNYILSLFSHDIGIDLGTANTMVHVRGRGIVIREPSVVVIRKKTKEVLAVGAEAKRMIGKTPADIVAIRPLRDGVIRDFEITEKMLSYFIQKVHRSPSNIPRLPRPRVIMGIPSGVTEVERRAVSDAALGAGARKVSLVEESMAAAIGAGLPIREPEGSMVVDIGGGTTEVAVISLGGIVTNRSLRVGGDEMDERIIAYAKSELNLLLGESTAEEIKIAIGSAFPFKGEEEVTGVLRGRDLSSGLPRICEVTVFQIRDALSRLAETIVGAVKDVLEDTPPELVADIQRKGLTLAGGGSQLLGFDQLLARETRLPVKVARDPMTCVVRGCGLLLEDADLLKRVQVL